MSVKAESASELSPAYDGANDQDSRHAPGERRVGDRVFRGSSVRPCTRGCIPCRCPLTSTVFAADAWFTRDSNEVDSHIRPASAITVANIAVELPPLLVLRRASGTGESMEATRALDTSGEDRETSRPRSRRILSV
jgi:hypothetical protein